MTNSSSGNHTFLILAHRCDKTLAALLRMLDDERNDIFLHMDAKCLEYEPETFARRLEHASFYSIPRRRVTWGGYSQILSELDLLEAAANQGRHAFYHLLSGQDLPIKSQNAIHEFFDAHQGTEFLRYDSQPFHNMERVYGHWLWNKSGATRYHDLLYRLDMTIAKAAQRIAHKEYDVTFQKGDNWFSISDEFARYVLSKSSWIEGTFETSLCADEVFMQTLLWNSPFKENVYRQLGEGNEDAIQRLIDWKRGVPYTFGIEDLEELERSTMLFARKFNCDKDSGVIDAVENMVKGFA